MNKAINMSFNRGTLVLKHYLAINASKPIGSDERGIYASVFAKDSVYEGYPAFVEIKVTSAINMSSPTDVSGSVNGITGGRILQTDKMEKFGYTSLPYIFGTSTAQYKNFSEFLGKGMTRTFWSTTGIDTHNGFVVTTNDGSVGMMALSYKR
jgi:hypothetical protein